MQQTRLNHLMIIDIYKDIVKTMGLSEVAKEFVGLMKIDCVYLDIFE